MPLKAGTVTDFSGSMAEAMEQAFEAAWEAVKGESLPAAGRDDRRLLLSAIAQGVVKHLAEQAGDAFEIGVEVTQVTSAADEPLIRSENTGTVSATGGGSFPPGRIGVTQVNASDNRLKSAGSATVTNVRTSGVLY